MTQMIATGRWPRDEQSEIRQNLSSLAPPHLIKPFCASGKLYFFHLPHCTVRQRLQQEKFWNLADAAPSELNPDLAVDIGDFGLGSDAPIVLDYREDIDNPRVLYLKWYYKASNHWELLAPDFPAFVQQFGL